MLLGGVPTPTAETEGRRPEEVGGTTSRGCRDPATLTRGRPHTGRPELPQDEALLALGQSQEEFIGFDALLAEREAHGIISLGSERRVPCGAV